MQREAEQPARGVDARTIDAGKRKRLRDAAGRDHHCVGEDRDRGGGAADGEQGGLARCSRSVVLVEADRLRFQHHLDLGRGQRAALLGRPTCRGRVRVDAEQDGAAQARVAFEERHPRAAVGRGQRGGDAGVAAAHHHDLLLAHGARNRRLRLVGKLSQARQPARHLQRHAAEEARAHQQVVVIEALGKEEIGGAEQVGVGAQRSVLPDALHPLAERHAAGGQAGHAVHAQEALPAGTGEAERAARAVKLDRPGEGCHARAQERRGDGVPFPSLEAIAVEGKAERPPYDRFHEVREL